MFKRRRNVVAVCCAIAGGVATGGVAIARGSAFTPGDVVVFQAGNGAGLLGSNTAYNCSLLEFNPTAINQSAPVQTIVLPSVDSGSQHALTSAGGYSDNLMSLSADGRYLSVIGLDVPAGSEYMDPSLGTEPAVDSPNRTIARIDGEGNVDTSTAGAFGAAGSSTRGTTTTNGAGFWYTTATGTTGTIGYVPLGGNSANLLASNYGGRAINTYSGQLYAISSTAQTLGVATVGSGLPTSGTQPVNPLPDTNEQAGNLAESGFFMATLKPGDTAPDVMYVSNFSSSGDINKYSYNGAAWVLTGQIEDDNATDITGTVSHGVVTLFTTSTVNGFATLSSLTDSNGWNAGISSSHLSTLYSVNNNGNSLGFRGLAMAPVASSAAVSGTWNSSTGGSWSTAGNWIGGVPNSVDASASFQSQSVAGQTIVMDVPVTVGQMTFNSASGYTLAGSKMLTLSSSAGAATITVIAGSHAIGVPAVAPAGLNVITQNNGSSPTLTLPANTLVTGTLTKSGPGTLAFAGSASGVATIGLESLTVNAGTVLLDSGATTDGNAGGNTGVNDGTRTLLQVGTMAFAGGRLDLGGNDLLVTGEPLSMVNTLVQNGTITSAAAAADSAHLTALGVIQNSVDGSPDSAALYGSSAPLGLFDGANPADTAVLVRYTYLGDTNLDGTVDGSDYSRIDAGYERGLTGWYNGDFNYDNIVDGSDYTLIDNAFNEQISNQQGDIQQPGLDAVITSQVAGASNVPEPGTGAGMISAAGIGLLRRKRKSGL